MSSWLGHILARYLTRYYSEYCARSWVGGLNIWTDGPVKASHVPSVGRPYLTQRSIKLHRKVDRPPTEGVFLVLSVFESYYWHFLGFSVCWLSN